MSRRRSPSRRAPRRCAPPARRSSTSARASPTFATPAFVMEAAQRALECRRDALHAGGGNSSAARGHRRASECAFTRRAGSTPTHVVVTRGNEAGAVQRVLLAVRRRRRGARADARMDELLRDARARARDAGRGARRRARANSRSRRTIFSPRATRAHARRHPQLAVQSDRRRLLARRARRHRRLRRRATAGGSSATRSIERSHTTAQATSLLLDRRRHRASRRRRRRREVVRDDRLAHRMVDRAARLSRGDGGAPVAHDVERRHARAARRAGRAVRRRRGSRRRSTRWWPSSSGVATRRSRCSARRGIEVVEPARRVLSVHSRWRCDAERSGAGNDVRAPIARGGATSPWSRAWRSDRRSGFACRTPRRRSRCWRGCGGSSRARIS